MIQTDSAHDATILAELNRQAGSYSVEGCFLQNFEQFHRAFLHLPNAPVISGALEENPESMMLPTSGALPSVPEEDKEINDLVLELNRS